MESKHEPTLDSSTAEDLVVIRGIKIIKDNVIFYFDRTNFNVWLENDNKHVPEIYELERISPQVYSFNCRRLPDLFAQTSLKLSLGTDIERLNYAVLKNYPAYVEGESAEFFLEEIKGTLLFVIKNKSRSLWSHKIDFLSLPGFSNKFERAESKNTPLKIAVIGTCFSRSVFRSDDFFNPGYKVFFSVPLTFFHNSLISLMSKSFKDTDYCLISDLLNDQVSRYIAVEFLKDLKERLLLAEIDYLVVDNYSDATLEAIEMSEDCFLTYNKYFSESIFKRKFSGKKIFVPGELKHIEKYREAVKRFYLVLQELDLDKRVILVGGRLSMFRSQSERWQSKISWIRKTNQNWDVCDAIFLEELPNAQYIDMRSTNWISDVNSPIIGGASPSHYQSGFYKEVYEKIMGSIFKEKI